MFDHLDVYVSPSGSYYLGRSVRGAEYRHVVLAWLKPSVTLEDVRAMIKPPGTPFREVGLVEELVELGLCYQPGECSHLEGGTVPALVYPSWRGKRA